MHLILSIELRSTLGLEIAGFAVAIITVIVAIQYLKPA